MITKIVSGGQTGADLGGLHAARELDIATGGYAPADFMTEDGPDPSLRDFGLVEVRDGSVGYFSRTRLNVLHSDGTLIVGDPRSPGSASTIGLCNKHRKPCLIVKWPLSVVTGGLRLRPSPQDVSMGIENTERFRRWVELRGIHTLNVAGNRESVAPGIHDAVVNFLVEAIDDQAWLFKEPEE